jgi:crotonobetainyl-CoA:carnitine CoA-transferase CaiB-like acyl-CoA transferase
MTEPMAPKRPLPLAGIRVVEFTHMVMGPTCGMVLGDLGAEVIKVEPLGGDSTRKQRCRLLPAVQPQQEKPGA